MREGEEDLASPAAAKVATKHNRPQPATKFLEVTQETDTEKGQADCVRGQGHPTVTEPRGPAEKPSSADTGCKEGDPGPSRWPWRRRTPCGQQVRAGEPSRGLGRARALRAAPGTLAPSALTFPDPGLSLRARGTALTLETLTRSSSPPSPQLWFPRSPRRAARWRRAPGSTHYPENPFPQEEGTERPLCKKGVEIP